MAKLKHRIGQENMCRKEKKRNVNKTIRSAENEACANINSKLGFKRSAEAWSVLKSLRKE
jgi:hypothetical protein